MLGEFKIFATRGNVVDMAVGIIIGAAFGKIIDSLVRDVIMPLIALMLGKVGFSNLFFVLNQGAVPGPYLSLDAAQKSWRSHVQIWHVHQHHDLVCDRRTRGISIGTRGKSAESERRGSDSAYAGGSGAAA